MAIGIVKKNKTITLQEAVFELLRGIEEDMDTYLALTNPEASSWLPNLKGFSQNLRMFSVRQPFPLLVAAHRKFSANDFETLLRSCVTISFRYNVIGNLPTHEQERVYHSVAQKISIGDVTSVAEALEAMTSVYPSDDVFRTAFSEKIIRTTNSRNLRIVCYILCALEKQVNGQDYDFESDSFNVEHVLPQNPTSIWTAFSNEEADAMTYRLGNMTLLNKGQNRDMGNAEFGTKKPVLAASNFDLTRKLAEENADWTPERIATRQKTMAKISTSIWRIAQLS